MGSLFIDSNMCTRIILLCICSSLAYAEIKSHMTAGHNTDPQVDKDLFLMSKEEMGEQNRELEMLVEEYKVMRDSDFHTEKLTLDEEQIKKAVIRIKALRANAAGIGETEAERKERIIRETKFRMRLLREMGQLVN